MLIRDLCKLHDISSQIDYRVMFSIIAILFLTLQPALCLLTLFPIGNVSWLDPICYWLNARRNICSSSMSFISTMSLFPTQHETCNRFSTEYASIALYPIDIYVKACKTLKLLYHLIYLAK